MWGKSIVGCGFVVMALPLSAAQLTLQQVWNSGFAKGTEIVSVQAATQRVAVSNSEEGLVNVLQLSSQGLQPIARFVDVLSDGEEMTAVAFHPQHDYLALAVRSGDALKPGRVLVLDGKAG